MKLHRISLRDFRGVTARDVTLADHGVTIVEGDNETGKSSLAEAVDLIIDLPDSSRAARITDVQPVTADVGPEVEIELSVGPHRFTYAKRWLRRPATTLTVHAPRPEQLTGRQAHERVEQILDEHADRALWKALRLDQGVALAQAGLGASRSLMRALEAASGASASADEAADLVQRAADEHGRYFTPSGQPNRLLKAAREGAEAARAHVDDLRGKLAALERDVEHHERLVRQLAESRPRRAEQAALVARLEAAVEEVTALGAEVERLGAAAKMAGLEAVEAREAVAKRAALEKRLQDKAAACEALALELARAESAIGAAGRERATLGAAVDAARRALAEAQAVAELAAADHEHQRRRMDRDLLQTRHEAVQAALERRSEAAAFLEACRVTAELVAEIDSAEQAVVTARAVLAAKRAVVRLRALADQELQIDGRPQRLSAGEVLEEPVSGTLEIAVPERLQLQVAAGADAQEQARSLAAARETLARLLRAAAVEDAAAARAQLQKRQAMTQAHQDAAAVLQTNLRDLTPEEMAGRLARLDERLAAYEAARGADPPLPPHLEAAENATRAADAALEAARLRAAEAEAALERAGADRVEAEKDMAATEARRDGAAAERDELLAELIAARAAAPDEALDVELALRESAARAATAALEQARARLQARDPDTARESLLSARSALERLGEEVGTKRDELLRLEGSLIKAGEQGLHDRLAEAETGAGAAERELERLERRARAARLLHDALTRHREAARRRYRAPLKARIEQLGRVVFGADLEVELDADLRIVRRTLDGVTLPYEALSTGAREQLGVIERLASAGLVSLDGGAPVVFDDALGYSDPERLRRLGAVMGMAGRECQVILLTCTPDRYSHVGGATVVRLEPTGGRADVGRSGAADAGAAAAGTEPA